MTPQETTWLLAYCAAQDPRFTTTDAEQAQARVAAWADTLDTVPADFALDQARRFYRTAQKWPLAAGAIRDAWVAEQQRARQVEAAAALEAVPRVPTEDRPPDVVAALASARELCASTAAAMGWT